jgi:deoxyadenosine/deoxycytidine kinase
MPEIRPGRRGYIAIEGPIGVGKTTLAEILANRLGGRLVLELAEENPFLADFYKNRDRFAFHTQIFFLMSRFRQQEEFSSYDLFSQSVVSDYLFAKDRIFARINLSDREFALYDRIATALEQNVVWPDLVIYLTASLETLMRRIKRRDRSFERGFDREYLEALCETYADYFFHYERTPLLVVKTDNVDFSREPDRFEYLAEKILSKPRNTEYISFESLSLDHR